ncbi:AraC family transcriptional regulator [Paenibacillus lentus]|uniref:AraC family transcriptional regulator n=1 Tax=Paenibacillus lentus TaxID=1338368 RepID=A0A3S8RZM1_9BACL|nr:AraC family transcriptional regulator [Paenibacillus lentus]AZK48402.1 AraC family transcriptional regulator [Paenibacillus lentus]
MESKMIFCNLHETVLLPVYATTLGYWRHQPETVRSDGFPDYQLHQVIEGKGELIIRDESYIVGPGDAFLLYPGISHCYAPISRQWQVAWVSFNGREAGNMLLHAGISESGPRKLKEEGWLPVMKQLLLLNENEAFAHLEYSKLLYALLMDLKRTLQLPMNQDYEMARIKPVLEYVDGHLHRALQLSDLAEVISVSPQYLCRLFQNTLQLRPMVYVNQQRINRSKQLMFSERDMKIYEIARRVGFENTSYFCSVFRKISGMSPKEFMRLHGL